jgi:hypothetical protein
LKSKVDNNMIQVKDKVRYRDSSLHKKFGVLVVWEIKAEYMMCKRNTFNTVVFVTVKSSLVKLFLDKFM